MVPEHRPTRGTEENQGTQWSAQSTVILGGITNAFSEYELNVSNIT